MCQHNSPTRFNQKEILENASSGRLASPNSIFRMNTRLTLREPAFVALVLLLAAGTPVRGQTTRSDYGAADIAYGARLYTMHCAQCHGATGDQVGTVNLRSGKFRNASTDQQIMNLVTSGIPASGMPGFKFNTAELAGIVAYLRNMNTFDAAAVSIGNADRGRALFEGKGGCRACHGVDGRGAGLAPDLGDIGAVRTADALQSSILDPSASISFGYEAFQLQLKSGDEPYGLIVSDTADEIAVKTQGGIVARHKKSDIAKREQQKLSIMPAGLQQTMSTQDLADLVEYLSSLKKAAR